MRARSGPATGAAQATAIPVKMSADDLPVGVHIIGPYLEDRTTLMLAELIERELGGFQPPKDFIRV
jgi:amidase